jgi:hypothetical protein
MSHLGDTNKMVRDTPRMDSVAGLASGIVDAAILAEGMELERELNRACEMYRKLDIHTLNLVDRIRRLEAAGDALLWYFCPKNTGDISFLQSEAIKQWNKAKEAKL